jgi:hypothetical protein
MSADQRVTHRFGGPKNQPSPMALRIHRSQSIFDPPQPPTLRMADLLPRDLAMDPTP